VVAAAIVLVALVTTAFTANWIRTKADALTPVDIPAAVPTPLKTVRPEGYLEPKIEGGFMINTLGDKMPVMPRPPWTNYVDQVTFRGVAVWVTVHENYDGKKNTWGNVVGFGMFQPKEPYKDLRNAAALVGGRMINQLYNDPKLAPIKGSVKHRDLTVSGHKAHEILARVPIKKPKLNETFSTLAILVVDRGDRTLAVSYGDFAGSTPQWVSAWREHVAKIEIAK
jgi:hypothetical protein